MQPKVQYYIPHASRSLLWIQFVAVAFRSVEVFFFFEEGDPLRPILSRPGSAPGQIWPNIFMHVPGHEHFIPSKFRKHPWSGSVVKADYVFPYIYMHLSTTPPFSP